MPDFPSECLHLRLDLMPLRSLMQICLSSLPKCLAFPKATRLRLPPGSFTSKLLSRLLDVIHPLFLWPTLCGATKRLISPTFRAKLRTVACDTVACFIKFFFDAPENGFRWQHNAVYI